ncbi:Swi3-domain-containing protein [Teratosphaeria destructans]|uniref:Chromosome segregation in meiosis protein n=1 Tax=Teratosphaeria destructans TaxID=418781 RepID=A0A9W7W6B8_9PEZI|nr:Swi3-domain-containing protein [Teratosphaeria destructans]
MPSAAAAPPPLNPGVGDAELDELDALFNEPSNNYDRAVHDFMRDMPIDGQENANLNQNPSAGEKSTDDPDAEIKIRKQRKPNPKLDENLLTSEKGIQKLRRTARAKLKFKGKGHEFSDMSRLLTMYQLWLDDMYPKAKFRDGLAMVEKLGHSKRMQVMRKAWIDETKPTAREESPERLGDAAQMGHGLEEMRDRSAGDGGMSEDATRANNRAARIEESRQEEDGPGDDELDALMAEQHDSTVPQHQPSRSTRRGPFEDDDGPDEDELDALMAEEQPPTHMKPAQKPKALFEEEEPGEDELDALLAEHGREVSSTKITDASLPTRRDDDVADDEEAMAGMW